MLARKIFYVRLSAFICVSFQGNVADATDFQRRPCYNENDNEKTNEK